MIYRITNSLSESDEPKPYGDFGFYNDVVDIELWVFYLENYQILPFSGALTDQPEDVLIDMHQFISIREYLKHQYKGSEHG